MAEIVITNAHIEINSADVSEYLTSVNLSTSVELQQATAFGDGWHTRVPGLKDFSFAPDFNQDFDASALDELMWGNLGVLRAWLIRPTSAVIGVNNPEYRGMVILDNYPPFGTGVGELVTGSLNFMGSGPLTRHTS